MNDAGPREHRSLARRARGRLSMHLDRRPMRALCGAGLPGAPGRAWAWARWAGARGLGRGGPGRGGLRRTWAEMVSVVLSTSYNHGYTEQPECEARAAVSAEVR